MQREIIDLGTKRRWRGADGRVRGVWVFVAFIFSFNAVSGVLSLPLMIQAATAGAPPQLPTSLEDWRLGLSAWPALLGALVGSWVVLRQFGERLTVAPKRPLGREVLFGLALGAGGLALVVLGPVIAGVSYLSPTTASGGQLLSALAFQLAIIVPMSCAEELIFRGVAFQALSRSFGPKVTILMTSVLFGAAHLANPGATVMAAVGVGLAGVWMSVVAWRHSLWAAMGLHAGWNVAEGFVFGQPVSGFSPGAALVQATPSLDPAWSGGSWGPEASIVALVVMAVAVAVALLPKGGDRGYAVAQ